MNISEFKTWLNGFLAGCDALSAEQTAAITKQLDTVTADFTITSTPIPDININPFIHSPYNQKPWASPIIDDGDYQGPSITWCDNTQSKQA